MYILYTVCALYVGGHGLCKVSLNRNLISIERKGINKINHKLL
jgi:hypothetical protein